MRLSVQTIKKQAKNGRFVSKALFEHVHSLIFDKNIPESPDRKYFEFSVIPFLAQIGVKNVLFVGCRAYTQHYPRLFEEQGITSGLPSFSNSTEHLAEGWLCCQQVGELSDQRL